MTRISLILTVAVLLVSALAGGAVAQSDDGDDLYESLEEMVPAYNANADAVDLGPVNLAGTTNIYIEDGGSEVTYSVTMDDRNRITDLDDSRSEDAVRKITTDRATIEEIAAADNPAAAFRNAVANDDIVISGEDGQILEGIKWAVINVFKGFFI
ncbi:hypothetical protein C461_08629 [Halorubrum aidingense JCM 13560]|uniref:SCP2 domain-containing protein n=1 Tax=Halorubrum aidingense JCM 13560 TaxID=1230454 RepID=M0PE05_9EURY|nr:hypothetical protein [Halorubrum aidingense]EMA67779.1 hypothetical protein C461_08629 [Halorubrum aidingense JCM 13560]